MSTFKSLVAEMITQSYILDAVKQHFNLNARTSSLSRSSVWIFYIHFI